MQTFSFRDSIRTVMIRALMIAMAVFFSVDVCLAQDSLLVVSSASRSARWIRYTDVSNSLYRYLSGQAFERLERRAEAVAKLKTADQWRKRQAEIRMTLNDIVGPFPEKTPLNARVTCIVRKDGFRVEKIVYESMPGYYVTSALFVPNDLKGKAPAILFCIGHSDAAFRRPLYQHVALNLVRKGFVVLAIDPVGQGERLQYYDPEAGESRIGGSTLEHSYPAAQCFLSGKSIARYFIWDGIRGIDYLLSREEVDPDRIGCHGLSGGGTQSSYIAAFRRACQGCRPGGLHYDSHTAPGIHRPSGRRTEHVPRHRQGNRPCRSSRRPRAETGIDRRDNEGFFQHSGIAGNVRGTLRDVCRPGCGGQSRHG